MSNRYYFLYAISFTLFVPLFVFAALMVGKTDTANAQEAEALRPPVIAILEYNKVERNSKAWMDFSKQFEEIKNQYETDIKNQQKALEERQKQLQQQASVLSPESFAAEEKKFRDAVLDLQRQTDQRKRDLDEVFRKATQQFSVYIANIAAEIANERKIDIVLNTIPRERTVFFWSEAFSITDEVSKRFDERFPTSSLIVKDE